MSGCAGSLDNFPRDAPHLWRCWLAIAALIEHDWRYFFSHIDAFLLVGSRQIRARKSGSRLEPLIRTGISRLSLAILLHISLRHSSPQRNCRPLARPAECTCVRKDISRFSDVAGLSSADQSFHRTKVVRVLAKIDGIECHDGQ
jgi:hypothetical protein